MAAFIGGLGGGAIDAALNGYVARNYGARDMSWLHACWGIGATIGAAVVATVLASDRSFRVAYGGLAFVELALSFAFVATRRLWSDSDRATTAAEHPTAPTAHPTRAAAHASVLMFFVYGGLESGTGLWAASLLTETRGASLPVAGGIVAAYWGAVTVGRILIGGWADRIGPARLLRLCTWAAGAATLGLLAPPIPTVGIAVALCALGLALAPIYPVAMHDTVHRFGPTLGPRLVGRQVAAAALGVATLPWLLGLIARRSSLLLVPPCLVVLAIAVIVCERLRRSTVS